MSKKHKSKEAKSAQKSLDKPQHTGEYGDMVSPEPQLKYLLHHNVHKVTSHDTSGWRYVGFFSESYGRTSTRRNVNMAAGKGNKGSNDKMKKKKDMEAKKGKGKPFGKK